MIQLLPRENTLQVGSVSSKDAVEFIDSYIKESTCENMSVDISLLNVLDACYVSTLCSAKHYIKYPNGKISWKISSELVKEFNKDMELGNSEYEFAV